MAIICDITGKTIQRGHHVSHSNRKTKRVFKPNLQKKTYYLEDENAYVTLKVSAKGMRLIDKIGIKAALKRGGWI